MLSPLLLNYKERIAFYMKNYLILRTPCIKYILCQMNLMKPILLDQKWISVDF